MTQPKIVDRITITMDDPELNAITEVAKALANLTDDQRRNVLLYINARYGGQHPARSPERNIDVKQEKVENHEHETLGDLFDAANPRTEAQRVLVVAYWTQVLEGADGFESYPINKHLKNLGHPVSNITRALDSMMVETPRLILQTSKSGSAKQARKRYKVTREGIKQVLSMLAQGSGAGDDK